MKILSLDQSTRSTGWALFTLEGCQLIDSGVIKEKSMEQMYYSINKLINDKDIDVLVFEDIYQLKGQKVFKILSQLQGLILSIVFSNKLQYKIIHPKTWKKCVGIKSTKRNQQKLDSIEICREIFGKEVGEDEADAILIGYPSMLDMSNQ